MAKMARIRLASREESILNFYDKIGYTSKRIFVIELLPVDESHPPPPSPRNEFNYTEREKIRLRHSVALQTKKRNNNIGIYNDY